MLLKTLLNRVHPVKGFVYASDTLVADALAPNGVRIEARLRARRRSKGVCSQCGESGPTYGSHPQTPLTHRLPLQGFAYHFARLGPFGGNCTTSSSRRRHKILPKLRPHHFGR